jgi:D-arabinose 1-dehydrogenase-like Zn-dependent alcohol dehydrogenase
MICFKHPEKDAIGTCKYCHRGICMDCTTDLEHGLACKGVHEEYVNTLHNIVMQSAKIYSNTPKTIYAAPVFFGFMGLVFLWFGLVNGDGLTDFATLLGFGFVGFAIYILIYNKKVYSAKKDIISDLR